MVEAMARRGARVAARTGAKLLIGVRDEVLERVEDERGVGGFARRRPLVGQGRGCFRAGIEKKRHEVGAGDPVDHAVVDLGDQGPPAAREALDHPGLPQRPVTVELLRHQPAHQGVQLGLEPRRGQRRVADVVREVEVRVIDPDRTAEAPWDEAHLLPVAGEQRQLAGH